MFSHQLLPILYYFQLKGIYNYIHIGEKNDPFCEFTDTIVKKFGSISNVDYNGSLFLSRDNSTDELYKIFVDYISSSIPDGGFIIISFSTDMLSLIKDKFNDIPKYLESDYHFVFIYSDALSMIYNNNLNVYASTQYTYKININRTKVYTEFLSAYFGISTYPYEMIEYAYTTITFFTQLIEKANSFDPAEIRKVSNNFSIETHHGISTLISNHITYGLYIIKPISEYDHEIEFSMKGPFPGTLRILFPDLLCFKPEMYISVLFLTSSEDSKKYYINPFSAMTMEIKRIYDVDYYSNKNILIYSYDVCVMPSYSYLMEYIENNNISVIFYGEMYILLLFRYRCELSFDKIEFNGKFIVFSYSKMVLDFSHDDVYHFGLLTNDFVYFIYNRQIIFYHLLDQLLE